MKLVLARVAKEVERLSSDIPETMRLRETELAEQERRLANFLDFIGEGRGSPALAKALAETEQRVKH